MRATITELRVAWEAACGAFTEQARRITRCTGTDAQARELRVFDALGEAETEAWNAFRDAVRAAEV